MSLSFNMGALAICLGIIIMTGVVGGLSAIGDLLNIVAGAISAVVTLGAPLVTDLLGNLGEAMNR